MRNTLFFDGKVDYKPKPFKVEVALARIATNKFPFDSCLSLFVWRCNRTAESDKY